MAKPVTPTAAAHAPAVVDIRTPEGILTTVPETDLGQAIEAGASIATPEELHSASMERQYGGAGGAAISAGLGVADGATFGLGPAAAVGVGGDGVRNFINNYRETKPEAYTGGQVLGTVGPLLVPGGAAGAAARVGRGLGAIPRAVAGIGRAAEGATGAVLGRGLAGRVAGTALGAGAEMALMNAGSQINEDVLGNHEVTGEKIFAALGEGFVSGAELGGALGVGNALVSRVAGGAARKIADMVTPSALRKKAEEFTARATNMKMHHVKPLGTTAEQIQKETNEISRTALNEGIMEGATKLDQSALTAKKVQEHGKALEEMRNALPKNTGVDLVPVLIDAQENILKPLAAKPMHEEVYATVQKQIDSVVKNWSSNYVGSPNYKGGLVPFTDAHAMRRAIDDILDAKGGFDSRNASIADGYLRKFRDTFEKQFEKDAEAAANLQGDSFLEKYNTTKKTYGNLRDLQKIYADEVPREQLVNQKYGLKDLMAGGVVTSFAGHVGGAIAGPVGGAVGAVGGTLAGALGNKFLRERGNQIMAKSFESASKLGLLQKTATQITKDVEDTVSAFLSKGNAVATFGAQAGRGATGRQSSSDVQKPYNNDRYLKDRAAIIAMHQNPQLIQERVSKMLPPDMAAFAPKVTTQLMTTGMLANNFMFSKLPAAPSPPSYFQYGSKRANRPVSDSELQKFGRYLQAIDRPTLLLKQLRAGNISRDSVEAVRNVYPNMFASIKSELVKQLGKGDVKLTKQQRTAMSIVFDVPVDGTTEPGYLKETQAAYEPGYLDDPAADGGQSGGEGSPPMAPKHQINLAGSFASSMDRIADNGIG